METQLEMETEDIEHDAGGSEAVEGISEASEASTQC